MGKAGKILLLLAVYWIQQFAPEVVQALAALFMGAHFLFAHPDVVASSMAFT